MIDSLSAIEACSGRCSQNDTPGSFVGIVENGPRISVGASGLGSHMSIWLGPPDSQNRITALRFPRTSVTDDSAWAIPGRQFAAAKAPHPASPACRNQRREPTDRVGPVAPA